MKHPHETASTHGPVTPEAAATAPTRSWPLRCLQIRDLSVSARPQVEANGPGCVACALLANGRSASTRGLTLASARVSGGSCARLLMSDLSSRGWSRSSRNRDCSRGEGIAGRRRSPRSRRRQLNRRRRRGPKDASDHPGLAAECTPFDLGSRGPRESSAARDSRIRQAGQSIRLRRRQRSDHDEVHLVHTRPETVCKLEISSSREPRR
jgi:hypothetical protein